MKYLKRTAIDFNKVFYFFHFINKRLWLPSMKHDVRLRIINFIKEGNHPIRMAPFFKKQVFQRFFYPFKVAFLAQLERFKNPFIKAHGSIPNQIPHLVIGHTPTYRSFKKITMEAAA